MPNNDERDVHLLASALKGCPPIHIEIDAACACVLLSQLQLALRYPMNRGYSAQEARRIADAIQEAIGRHSPEAFRLLERGWHEVYDRPARN